MLDFLHGFEKFYRNFNFARFVILPVPFEATTTYGKGAKNGPAAILKASQEVELYDQELDREPYKAGLHVLPPIKSRANPHLKIYRAVKNILQSKKFPIVLGGEHSISLGAVKAGRQFYPKLSVLQLDAHADLRDRYHGSRHNHACTARRILEVCPAVQVGIRSMDIEEVEWARKSGQWKKICFANQILNPKSEIRNKFQIQNYKSQTKILKQLTEQVYITIDVDVFDPSLIPSTGTPEPGGLGWYQVLDILRAVVSQKQVVGFDVVELAPIKGLNAPDFIIAKLVYKLMGYLNRSFL